MDWFNIVINFILELLSFLNPQISIIFLNDAGIFTVVPRVILIVSFVTLAPLAIRGSIHPLFLLIGMIGAIVLIGVVVSPGFATSFFGQMLKWILLFVLTIIKGVDGYMTVSAFRLRMWRENSFYTWLPLIGTYGICVYYLYLGIRKFELDWITAIWVSWYPLLVTLLTFLGISRFSSLISRNWHPITRLGVEMSIYLLIFASILAVPNTGKLYAVLHSLVFLIGIFLGLFRRTRANKAWYSHSN